MMDENEGSFIAFTLPAAGTLRVQADCADGGNNLDIYMTYHGCPNLRAMLTGGCVVLARDLSAAKPAEFTLGIVDHDLTVDPAMPGVRIIYVFNRGPRRESGTLEVTLTTTGTAPDANPDPVAMPQTTNPGDVGGGPLPPTAACDGTEASIVSLDKVAERVVIRKDAGPGDLSGWELLSTLGNQRFEFPDGFVMGERVEVRSGTEPCSSSSTVLCWTRQFVWNNEETETAQLFDCEGTVVDSFTT